MRRLGFLFVAAWICLATPTLNAAELVWATAAAETPLIMATTGAGHAVLLDETIVAFEANGTYVETHREAVKILTQAGYDWAIAQVGYDSASDKLTSFDAWLLRNGKPVKFPDPPRWIDAPALKNTTAFTELRHKTVSFRNLVSIGDVIAVEWTCTRRALFNKAWHTFNSRAPLARERFRVTVPAGWTIETHETGKRPVARFDTEQGGRTAISWEENDAPYTPFESSEDFDLNLDRTIVVTVSPRNGTPSNVPRFTSWETVSRWGIQIVDTQCDRTPAISAFVARSILPGSDRRGVLAQLSREVQSMTYVSVEKGLGIGLGYQPRKASEVLSTGWGDCKDKATLLLTLLKEAGIESYLTLARVAQPEPVENDYYSPDSFNHAILAIRVDDTFTDPAVVNTLHSGRLLFFDATSEDTLLGDLPAALQGTRVLVLAPGESELTTLPDFRTSPDAKITRQIELHLRADGNAVGTGSLSGRGQAGAYLRGLLRNVTQADLKNHLSRLFSTALRGVRILSYKGNDDLSTGACTLAFELEADHLIQPLDATRWVAKLDPFPSDFLPALPEKSRVHPVELNMGMVTDICTIEIPKDLTLEVLPKSGKVESTYGMAIFSYSQAGNRFTSEKTFLFAKDSAEAEDYASLKKFQRDIQKMKSTSLVLTRTAPL